MKTSDRDPVCALKNALIDPQSTHSAIHALDHECRHPLTASNRPYMQSSTHATMHTSACTAEWMEMYVNKASMIFMKLLLIKEFV